MDDRKVVKESNELIHVRCIVDRVWFDADSIGQMWVSAGFIDKGVCKRLTPKVAKRLMSKKQVVKVDG